MKQNWNKESLLAAYPRFEAQPDFYLGRMADAEKGFADTFGKEAERFFSAPGRTEIGGNHTDHQHGCVLAAAVDLDIFGAAAKMTAVSSVFSPKAMAWKKFLWMIWK